jgi:hypothetical protein
VFVNCIPENFFHLFVLTISLSVEGRKAAQEEVEEEQEAIEEPQQQQAQQEAVFVFIVQLIFL